MAMHQDRYVKITSTNIGDSAITDRDLGGMVFTQGKGWIYPTDSTGEYDPEAGTVKPMPIDSIVVCYTSDQALKYFGSTSQEYAAAVKYFSYLSRSGTSPSSLSFVRVKVADANGNLLVYKLKSGTTYAWYTADGTEVTSPVIEDPVESLSRVNADSNNFGSFAFVDMDYTCAQMKAVMVANKGYNYKYLFCAAVLDAGKTAAADSVLMNVVSATSFATYIGEMNGTHLMNCSVVTDIVLPMAIFGAVNYGGINTATYFMFKQMDGITETITSDDVADVYDAAKINYYGLVQINGQRKGFYQRGVNLDGENTAVYCNEIWLKSRISTDIIDLMLSVEKIPANDDGSSMILGIVCAAAEVGITNGTIEVGKTITDSQKRKIYTITGDSEAWMSVQNVGYYATCEIKQDGSEYKAYYKLVYGKGDAICYVEGTDVLV